MTALATEDDLVETYYDWRGTMARKEQLPPDGDWLTWLVKAGRGFGKTRAGSEFVREHAEQEKAKRMILLGASAGDVRDVMVEGESGILEISHPSYRPVYEPSKRRLTWPNGATAMCYSADNPDLLRGPQSEIIWADELAKWRRPLAWDNALLGLRLGPRPRAMVTTTPRPVRAIRELMASPSTVVTGGSTHDNLANLNPHFRDLVLARYEGTTLGRQEIGGELLEETPGALWARSDIDANRLAVAPPLSRIVVGVDPSITTGGNEAGIIGIGCTEQGRKRHLYVLADASVQGSPDTWARRAVGMYTSLQADRIIGEVNQGGEMVGGTIRTVDESVSYKAVHASRGKQARAEPVAALYEQGRVHHIGVFEELEDEMCTWVPGESDWSPNRLDALVWGATELIGGGFELIAPHGQKTAVSRWRK